MPCIYACIFTYLSVYLFVYLSIYLFICLYICAHIDAPTRADCCTALQEISSHIAELWGLDAYNSNSSSSQMSSQNRSNVSSVLSAGASAVPASHDGSSTRKASSVHVHGTTPAKAKRTSILMPSSTSASASGVNAAEAKSRSFAAFVQRM